MYTHNDRRNRDGDFSLFRNLLHLVLVLPRRRTTTNRVARLLCRNGIGGGNPSQIFEGSVNSFATSRSAEEKKKTSIYHRTFFYMCRIEIYIISYVSFVRAMRIIGKHKSNDTKQYKSHNLLLFFCGFVNLYTYCKIL